jgi:hypothetical protein
MSAPIKVMLDIEAVKLDELSMVAEELRAAQLRACELLSLIEAQCEIKPEELVPLIVAMNRAERFIKGAFEKASVQP